MLQCVMLVLKHQQQGSAENHGVGGMLNRAGGLSVLTGGAAQGSWGKPPSACMFGHWRMQGGNGRGFLIGTAGAVRGCLNVAGGVCSINSAG